MNWTRVGLYGIKSGPWRIGKIISSQVPRYVLSKKDSDSLGWFDTADEAKQKVEELKHDKTTDARDGDDLFSA